MTLRLRTLLQLSFSSFVALAGSSSRSAQVATFFPTGSVKQVQQATASFSADMVALGDPRSKHDPFDITCNRSGDTKSAKPETPKHVTRWADTKHWVLDFDQPLSAGVRCTFQLKADTKDLAGNPVDGINQFSFSTSGPALIRMAPMYGKIEPDQYFIAQTDGPLNHKSVEAKSYFEVAGLPDKVGVQVVTGAARDTAIKQAIKDSWEWNEYRQATNFENFIVLAASRRFPDDAKVVLHWPAGILSQSGVPVEDAQHFDFTVIEPFTAKFSCERSSAERPCNPILRMQVNFSQPVSANDLRGAKLVSADGRTWLPQELKKTDQDLSSLSFAPPFPDRTKFKIFLPTLKDAIGRPLANQNKYPLEVSTDEYSPLIKFPAPFGILELNADPTLPVSVRNVETPLPAQQIAIEGKTLNLSGGGQIAKIIGWYLGVTHKEQSYYGGESEGSDKHIDPRNKPIIKANEGTAFKLPKPLGERAFELVGIPLKKPGFYVVEMQSPRLGKALTAKGAPMYVATTALVTNMAVHFKKGRDSSLVWVTQLSDAHPVGGAKVSLVTEEGKELASGTTSAAGTLRFGKINYPCADEGEYSKCEVFAFAQKGDDVSFSSSAWSKGIETYRFNVPVEYLSKKWGPIVAHTVLDRMAAQPGDTIHMKHILREHRETGFSYMDAKHRPQRVIVVHEGSQKTYTLPFDYDAKTGSATGEFQIPKNAALGRYAVYLSNGKASDQLDYDAQQSARFVVSEYRLPLMKATIKVQGDTLVSPTEVKADLSASYLSGGPAKGLKVKLRSSLQAGYFAPDVPGGSDYNFFATPMKAGVRDSENHQSADEAFLKVQELTLGADGGTLASVRGLPAVTKIEQLSLEMEYKDPNGETKTTSSQVPLFPADYAIGLRSDGWYFEPGKTQVMGVITNNKGKVQSGRAFSVEAFRTNYLTHRKRLVGGFYSYDSKSEVVALGKVCQGTSDALGRFTCTPKQLPAGSITLQAKSVDDKGRATYAAVNVSVHEAGDDSWWVPSDSDRIDLLPEQTRYEPGQKARLVVRSPYPTAMALITVEREGVLDSFVTEIHRDNPSVEVPMKGNYAPNVFVSALLVRGRVGDPQPTALLDLARPAMKMGIAELKVGWKAHELGVSVKTDKTKYHTREKVQVAIQVKAPEGTQLPANAEVAVAAVDESLLRLKENTSWKLLREMMGQRPLAVTTNSGQNQVVGRRHFGSKAKAPGGDGGVFSADTRELFDPLLLWQARVKLDAKGEAKLSIPLNDSMTSFRIVAVATAGENLFGDGSANVESSKDLILYSGFAPLAREGDQIKNAFTVRNTTDKTMHLSFDVTAPEIPTLPKIAELELKPSEARTLELPLTIPTGVKEINFRLRAHDASGTEDSLVAKVRVEPAVRDQVLQATLFQLAGTQSIPVRQPTDNLTGRGGLNVQVRPTLQGGLAGVRDYMDRYDYNCLEQQISRGIVASDSAGLKRVVEALPAYIDSEGLLKFFPDSTCGSPQLTRYALNILQDNDFEIPQVTTTRLTQGLKAYIQGKTKCEPWWDSYSHDTYASEGKVLAMESLARRKAFTPDLLTTVQVTPMIWKTETVTAWFQLLKRSGDIPKRDELLAQAENILRSRVNFQGSAMNLQGELDWQGRWRLLSSADQEAMGVLGVAIDESSWAADAGRMARALIARQKLGHWDTTMANAWGVTQMRRFSAKFESEAITGETKVAAGDQNASFDWKAAPKGNAKQLSWPKGSERSDVPVQISHAGTGKPWVHLESVAAIPLKAPLDMGYKVTRKVTPVVQAKNGSWQVGDVANVELTVTAKADQPWVVIRDAIPAGAAHLGTGLDGSSNILDRVPKKNAGAGDIQPWPSEFEEKSQSNFTAYAAYLPRGTYRVNYRVRLNSAGEFLLPPTRVEAMYSPEMFGEVPNESWKVAR